MDYGQEILNGESREWREIRICNTLMPVMFLILAGAILQIILSTAETRIPTIIHPDYIKL